MQPTVHLLQEEMLNYTSSSSPHHGTPLGDNGLQTWSVAIIHSIYMHGTATAGHSTRWKLDTGITVHLCDTLCYEMFSRILDKDG
jgi:hypothetical protein